MSGHSKWANIKHKKGATDEKRGKIFTKIAKLITVAAQHGGGDPEMNPSLRLAIQKAKSANLPAANIDRAIKKGTGALKGDRLEEVIYEGYGPEGVAIMIRALTDNTNRSYSNIRTIMMKHGGSLGSSGCVAWIFDRKGIIEMNDCPERKMCYPDKQDLELALIESGAEDLEWQNDILTITCPPGAFESCRHACKDIPVQKSEISLIPRETKVIDNVQNLKKVLDLLKVLNEDEDVDSVFVNIEL